MRLPIAALLTACALSAALLVAGRDGAGVNGTMPGSEVVLPAAEGRALFADSASEAESATEAETEADFDADPGVDLGPDAETAPGLDADAGLDRGLAPDVFDPNAVGPETVPEVPDLPDGGGLIPDGPDESEESGASGASEATGIVFGSPADALSG
ncbi:hypothetical protein ABZ725_05260 [Streptomyces sp. NPDC006872]|uniref:hypothetical protein n=1 Tax=Streptomyces sp. NPDC006872 TaxID=3155720 RepID=UPI00340BC44A